MFLVFQMSEGLTFNLSKINVTGISMALVAAGAVEADGADAGAGALHVFSGEEFLSSPTRCST